MILLLTFCGVSSCVVNTSCETVLYLRRVSCSFFVIFSSTLLSICSYILYFSAENIHAMMRCIILIMIEFVHSTNNFGMDKTGMWRGDL